MKKCERMNYINVEVHGVSALDGDRGQTPMPISSERAASAHATFSESAESVQTLSVDLDPSD